MVLAALEQLLVAQAGLVVEVVAQG